MSSEKLLPECKARAILCDIKKLLISNGICNTILESNEPDLKRIEIRATIKVKA